MSDIDLFFFFFFMFQSNAVHFDWSRKINLPVVSAWTGHTSTGLFNTQLQPARDILVFLVVLCAHPTPVFVSSGCSSSPRPSFTVIGLHNFTGGLATARRRPFNHRLLSLWQTLSLCLNFTFYREPPSPPLTWKKNVFVQSIHAFSSPL